jgi:hypothetical protein
LALSLIAGVVAERLQEAAEVIPWARAWSRLSTFPVTPGFLAAQARAASAVVKKLM